MHKNNTFIQKSFQKLKIIAGAFLLFQASFSNFACAMESQQQVEDKKTISKKKFDDQEFYTFQQLYQTHDQLHQQQTFRISSQLTQTELMQIEQLHNELHHQQQASDLSLTPIEKFHAQLHDQQERYDAYSRSTYH